MHPILDSAGLLGHLRSMAKSQHPRHVYLIDGNGIIRSEFGYGPMTKEVFEGKGLFAEIDRLLAGATQPSD